MDAPQLARRGHPAGVDEQGKDTRGLPGNMGYPADSSREHAGNGTPPAEQRPGAVAADFPVAASEQGSLPEEAANKGNRGCGDGKRGVLAS